MLAVARAARLDVGRTVSLRQAPKKPQVLRDGAVPGLASGAEGHTRRVLRGSFAGAATRLICLKFLLRNMRTTTRRAQLSGHCATGRMRVACATKGACGRGSVRAGGRNGEKRFSCARISACVMAAGQVAAARSSRKTARHRGRAAPCPWIVDAALPSAKCTCSHSFRQFQSGEWRARH